MTEQTSIPATPDTITMPIPEVDDPASTASVQTSNPSLSSRAVLILVSIVLLLVWQWLSTRHRFNEIEHALSQQLEQLGDINQQSLALARRADDRSEEANARTALLEQKLAESRDQQEALQTLYLELANNREERVITEVEQLLIIANQQLQLAGNVKPALLALQTADTRLQPLDASQIVPLRKSIAQDIQRLQALPLIDIVGMSMELDEVVDAIDTLPLVSERHPASGNAPEPVLASNVWHRLAQEVWLDIRSLIKLERVDRPEPPLLAPDQTFFLRENLKLHLLTARIALLQHDQTTYRHDLLAADAWLRGHFDLREVATQNALSTIKGLSASNLLIQLPDISQSLGLVSQYKLALEQTSERSANEASRNAPAASKHVRAAAKPANKPAAGGSQ